MIEISKSFPEILVSVHVCWVKCGVHNAYSSHLIYEKSEKKINVDIFVLNIRNKYSFNLFTLHNDSCDTLRDEI